MRELLQKYAELDLDAVFIKFYDTLLSDSDFSSYFKDDEQVKSLVVRQKKFLLDSIAVSDEEVKARYIKLGELHYGIKLPYAGYMASINILQDGLIHAVAEFHQPQELLDATANFFKLIRTFSAKGYLNKMIEADIRDIDLYLSQVQSVSKVDILLSTERMIWLKNVILAIKVEIRPTEQMFHPPVDILNTMRLATQGDQVLMNYVAEIAGRIEVDASSIFYFLDRHSYEEVLPLYQELILSCSHF